MVFNDLLFLPLHFLSNLLKKGNIAVVGHTLSNTCCVLVFMLVLLTNWSDKCQKKLILFINFLAFTI